MGTQEQKTAANMAILWYKSELKVNTWRRQVPTVKSSQPLKRQRSTRVKVKIHVHSSTAAE